MHDNSFFEDWELTALAQNRNDVRAESLRKVARQMQIIRFNTVDISKTHD